MIIVCITQYPKIHIFENCCCFFTNLGLTSLIFKSYHNGQLTYSKTCLKRPLSNRPKIGFHAQLSLNAGQKCCRMLQGEHSAILSTFIMLPFVIKIFALSIFEWPLKTGFTVYHCFYADYAVISL